MLESEGTSISSLSNACGWGIAAAVMAPGIYVSTDSPFAVVALRNGLLATENSVEASRDRLLESLNRFKIKNEQLKKLMLEKSAGRMTMLLEGTSALTS